MFQECNAVCLRHPHLECARCYLVVEVRSGPLQSPVPLQQRLLHHNPPQRQKRSKARQNIANMEEHFKNVGNQSTSNQMSWTAWVAALALTHLSGIFSSTIPNINIPWLPVTVAEMSGCCPTILSDRETTAILGRNWRCFRSRRGTSIHTKA